MCPVAELPPGTMRLVEKSLLLQIFDAVWKEHLLALDHLRQGIGLRAYGQRDPLNEYKSEAFGLFNAMLAELRERVTSLLMRIELQPDAPLPSPEPVRVMDMRHPEPAMAELEMAGEGGPGYTIRDELNELPYLRGTVGMALDWEDTGGSQFFITHSPQPHLDARYTVFGRVVSGMDVVDRLAQWDVIRNVRIRDGVNPE